jgi:hypothetical protein
MLTNTALFAPARRIQAVDVYGRTIVHGVYADVHGVHNCARRVFRISSVRAVYNQCTRRVRPDTPHTLSVVCAAYGQKRRSECTRRVHSVYDRTRGVQPAHPA